MVGVEGAAEVPSRAAGKEKRKAQSRRYRERVRDSKERTGGEAADEAARVISPKFF